MRSDKGSTLPLIITFGFVLLALTLTLGELISMRLAQDRVQSDARFAALYLVRETGDIPFIAGFDYADVVAGQLPEAERLSAISQDTKTMMVRICERWESPFGLHPPGKTCDEAKARLKSFDGPLA